MENIVLHPGVILERRYLLPLGVNPNRLARDVALVPARLYNLIAGTVGVTADTALRLAKFFETLDAKSVAPGDRPGEPMWWMSQQAAYDVWTVAVTEEWDDLKGRILQYRQASVSRVPRPKMPGVSAGLVSSDGRVKVRK